jgi:hypothetical protein
LVNQLSGFKAKLKRADEHLEALDDEIAEFLDSHPYAVRFEIDRETGQHVAKIKVRRDPPAIRWGLLIGDCVHNMRSALDHLAWQLAGPKPPPKTEFPIFHDRKEFKRKGPGGGLYKIRGIKDPKARALIKSVQPCRSDRSPPKVHPLYALWILSNTDKHQMLHLAVGNISSASYWPGKSGDEFIDSLSFGTFHDDAEIGRFTLDPGETHPDVDVDVNFGFDITFDQGGPGAGWPVVGGLTRIRECIRADIAAPVARLYESS